MKLSTDEKASIGELLHLIANHHIINNKATDLPLYYIPRATHSLLDIIAATKHLATSDLKDGEILNNPLYSALTKSGLAIVDAEGSNFSGSNLIAIDITQAINKEGTWFITIDLAQQEEN